MQHCPARAAQRLAAAVLALVLLLCAFLPRAHAAELKEKNGIRKYPAWCPGPPRANPPVDSSILLVALLHLPFFSRDLTKIKRVLFTRKSTLLATKSFHRVRIASLRWS